MAHLSASPSSYSRRASSHQSVEPTDNHDLPDVYFSVRLTNIDHYMVVPGPMDRQISPFSPENVGLNQVPVIRIFGSTPGGQKCCMHVHQVFPYFYIPYDGDLAPDVVQSHIYQLATSLNQALTLSQNRNPNDYRYNQHLAAIVLVKGVNVYGYHVGYSYFLKLYLVNPDSKWRMVELLQGGTVMGRRYQPFESHVPYLLQFMLDHNLYGMGFIDVSQHTGYEVTSPDNWNKGLSEYDGCMRFRCPLPDRGPPLQASDRETPPIYYLRSNVPPAYLWPSDMPGFARQSYTELEADVTAMSIINRRRVAERDIHKDFGEAQALLYEMYGKRAPQPSISSSPALDNLDTQTVDEARFVKSLQMLWKDESRRRVRKGLSASVPSVTQHEIRAPQSSWANELLLRQGVQRLVDADGTEDGVKSTDLRKIAERMLARQQDYDTYIMTAFQSVEALFPKRRSIALEQQIKTTSGEKHHRDYQSLAEDWLERLQRHDIRSQSPSDPLLTQINDPHLSAKQSQFYVAPSTPTKRKAALYQIADSPSKYQKLGQINAVIDRQKVEVFQRRYQTALEELEPDVRTPNDMELSDLEAILEDPLLSLEDRVGSALDNHLDGDGDNRYNAPAEQHQTEDGLSEDQLNELLDQLSDYALTQTSEPAVQTGQMHEHVLSELDTRPESTTIDGLDQGFDNPPLPEGALGSTQAPSISPTKRYPLSQLSKLFSPTTAGRTLGNSLSRITSRVNSFDEADLEGLEGLEGLDFDDEIGFTQADTESDHSPSLGPRQRLEECVRRENNSDFIPQLDGAADDHHVRPFFISIPRQNVASNEFHLERSNGPTDHNSTRSCSNDKAAGETFSQHNSNIDNAYEDGSNSDALGDLPHQDPQIEERFPENEVLTFTPPHNSPAKQYISRRITLIGSDIISAVNGGLDEECFTATITELWSPRTSPVPREIPHDQWPVPRSPNQTSWTTDKHTSLSSPKTFLVGHVSQPLTISSKDNSHLDPSNVTFASSSQEPSSNNSCQLNDAYQSLLLRAYGAFAVRAQSHRAIFFFGIPAPSLSTLEATRDEYDVPSIAYTNPYFSVDSDVPDRPKVFAGREFRLKSHSPRFLKEFQSETIFSSAEEDSISSQDSLTRNPSTSHMVSIVRAQSPSMYRSWTWGLPPPSIRTSSRLRQQSLFPDDVPADMEDMDETARSVKEAFISPGSQERDPSQIEAPTQPNMYGFKFSQHRSSPITPEKEYVDTFSVEVYVTSRGDFLPIPNEDPISLIFWAVHTDKEVELPPNGLRPGYRVGIMALEGVIDIEKCGITGYDIKYVKDELGLFEALVDVIRLYDPDILTGYEIHNSSWGYLIERAGKIYQINLCDELSRVRMGHSSKATREDDAWGFREASSIHVNGRHMLNIWRLMKGEINLNSYTYENITFHILHKRVPHYSYRVLSQWFTKGQSMLKRRVLMHYIEKVQVNLELLDEAEIVSRTSEFARIFGVDFFSVISRGSQFKVESVMIRIAKPENLLLLSPSRKQVGEQRAAECLPLVMEPESRFYPSPLLVLDFQSLYPSVMIAYNLCYTTCLGKITEVGGPTRFGVTELKLPDGTFSLLKDYITVTPNGMMFVKPTIRRSLLAKMLTELLDTRVMIKRAMKENKDNKALLRVLNSRQLGLKYLANVTYGYTSASFSGRMPGVEIADSIVQCGRETLERAIEVINTTARWGARVVYGDTDSVFVYLPGKSRNEAFEIGADISDTITRMNPSPIRLKFEKVYHPCVLLTKKRYVGFKYETPDTQEPEFDAKGIETIRRDGVPAVQKMMETSLKILFRHQDLSQLKAYLQRQWRKILAGRVSIQDFIFAKEVKLGSYSERGLLPPGAFVSTKKMVADPRSEPQYGERVPYVVVYGKPGARLIDQVVSPELLLKDRTLRLHGHYYITKQIIPSLERIFNLVGADLKSWFDEMPRMQRAIAYTASQQDEAGQGSSDIIGGRTIDQYYMSRKCKICGIIADHDLCETCSQNPSQSAYNLAAKSHLGDTKYQRLLEICKSCSGVSGYEAMLANMSIIDIEDMKMDYDHPCNSMDCPVFFERTKLYNHIRNVTTDTLLQDLYI
ncbi:hypothetical protein BZG36_00882 [Bifiguratus adelaidae]|uniref:DNA polymerase zeta catalytic subunit n=1 Tax=Bifiguratus adelaidae TaxID=1938954 RepID=A0A261Y5D4_9FUNG|nr:hypothetical protein BZG36_00882 [Bifiguratus adelaidae]